MNAPPKDPNSSGRAAHPEDDEYGLSAPVERPEDHLRTELIPARESVVTVEEPPPPPKLPFVTGVFTFLVYLQTFAVWAVGSVGLRNMAAASQRTERARSGSAAARLARPRTSGAR